MSWITQGFLIGASLSIMVTSGVVIYSLIKGRAIVEQQLAELDKTTKRKKAELDHLVDAAAALIKD